MRENHRQHRGVLHILSVVIVLLLPATSWSVAEAQRPEKQSTFQEIQEDTLQVYFRQGRTELDPMFRNNSLRLESFARRFERLYRDPAMKVTGIRIVSSASPEGSVQINERVASARASSIVHFMHRNFSLSPRLFEVVSLNANWKDLQKMVEASPFMPHRWEVLELLRFYVPPSGYLDEVSSQRLKRRLGEIGGGKAWDYMYSTFFPELRHTIVHIAYEGDKKPPVAEPPAPEPIIEVVEKTDTLVIVQKDTLHVIERDTVLLEVAKESKPFYMSVRTNLLADLLITPNVGLEFHLGSGFSLMASGTFAWWDNDPIHIYWRIYGGDLELRKYFGRKASEKPLQGHHVGIYGQWYSWDFELGHRAYQSAKGTWSGGLSYGYSLPIGRHFNLDFGIGVGYVQGEYEEALPDTSDGTIRYVWQSTSQGNYIGPTKVGVTLMWLIGNGNNNKKK